MKKTLLILSFLSIIAGTAFSQNDTLLFENFDVDPTLNYAAFNSGNDTTWVDFDADGLPDANARPQNWYWSEGAFSTPDEFDACLFSSSWLAGFLPGNRNWLMTPPIDLTNVTGATLSWESAPRQTPLYLDGYTVLLSTTDNIESSFTDTLFQAAQFLTGTGNDWSTYTFSPGFVHGLDGTYIEYDPTSTAGDSSRFIGVFRPFSASLAQYSGQTVYIAFLHDSDDDNLVALDDILITGTLVGINELADNISLNVYPNPATDKVNVSFTLKNSSQVRGEIYDVRGVKVMTLIDGTQPQGSQKVSADISSFADGLYNLVLTVDGNTVSKRFIKN
jgi:hypothetical protein